MIQLLSELVLQVKGSLLNGALGAILRASNTWNTSRRDAASHLALSTLLACNG
jgi:hypothetical protein